MNEFNSELNEWMKTVVHDATMLMEQNVLVAQMLSVQLSKNNLTRL